MSLPKEGWAPHPLATSLSHLTTEGATRVGQTSPPHTAKVCAQPWHQDKVRHLWKVSHKPQTPPAECWLGKGTFGVETCLLLFHLIFWEVWVLISLFFLESKSSIESHLWSWKVLYCLNVAGADVPAAFLGEVVHSLRKKLEWSFIQKSLLRSSSS